MGTNSRGPIPASLNPALGETTPHSILHSQLPVVPNGAAQSAEKRSDRGSTMAKQRNPNATNIDNAGEQDVESALENADNSSTQAAVADFQQSIEGAAEEARPNVDDEQWGEIVAQARETETEFERHGSRGDQYDNEGWDAVPEEERPPDVEVKNTDSQEADTQQEDVIESDSVDFLDREQTLRNRIQEGQERATLENVPYEQIKEHLSDAEQSQLGGMMAQADQMTGDPSAGAAVASEEHLFNDPEAALQGEEEIALPDDKTISGGEEPPEDPLPDSIPKDEVTGIDVDEIEAPESNPAADSELDSESGYHEMVERIAGQQAEMELRSRDAALRADAGESPLRASREAVRNTDYREQRPWVTTADEDSGADHLYRFVPADPDNPSSAREAKADVYQSFEVRKEIAKAQYEEFIGGEVDSITDIISDPLESIANGEEIMIDGIDPAPAAEQISAKKHESIGETAAANLHEAGYTRISDLKDATESELAEVDGIGETKAQDILNNEGERAQKIKAEAAKVNMELRETTGDLGQEEFERIIEYGAKKGVTVDKMGDILRQPNMQKEMPGPTPVSALEAGDTEQRRKINRNSDSQYLPGHETESGTTHRPNDSTEHAKAPPVTVSATVERAFEPNNPNAERQVVEIRDHNQNVTKLTVYRDSLNEPDDEMTAGYSTYDTTHPEDGVDPNVVLKPGDEVEIINPQINEYGGGNDDRWDGPTLATTPSTTLDTGGESLRPPSMGIVSRGTVTRGSPNYGDDDEDKTIALKRRERKYEEKHGSKKNRSGVVEDDEDDSLGDVDADI